MRVRARDGGRVVGEVEGVVGLEVDLGFGAVEGDGAFGVLLGANVLLAAIGAFSEEGGGAG